MVSGLTIFKDLLGEKYCVCLLVSLLIFTMFQALFNIISIIPQKSVLFTSASHKIISKPLVVFPNKHRRNYEGNVLCGLNYSFFVAEKNIWEWVIRPKS